MMGTQVYGTEQQEYTAGFHMAEKYVFKSERGLSKKVVEQISEMKGEPDWMRQFCLKSLALFEKRPMLTWGADLSGIDFDPGPLLWNDQSGKHILPIGYECVNHFVRGLSDLHSLGSEPRSDVPMIEERGN
ncbi:hypothetical protein KSC_014780 [Ktedonobacter sp. SOSP1-52]|uniref:hypothetical protein n=1 Tax=Ktedonobacter sp. SOSP1-52 TaxID=2778366 RepID=UPI0019155D55|nr:hypothetical protein [Ktedonobacter sp. SOSP1-52]GHO62586.1 hypothetical protein KSC_014780 [Ktedonobacter sp. SOSP1-52]